MIFLKRLHMQDDHIIHQIYSFEQSLESRDAQVKHTEFTKSTHTKLGRTILLCRLHSHAISKNHKKNLNLIILEIHDMDNST